MAWNPSIISRRTGKSSYLKNAAWKKVENEIWSTIKGNEVLEAFSIILVATVWLTKGFSICMNKCETMFITYLCPCCILSSFGVQASQHHVGDHPRYLPRWLLCACDSHLIPSTFISGICCSEFLIIKVLNTKMEEHKWNAIKRMLLSYNSDPPCWLYGDKEEENVFKLAMFYCLPSYVIKCFL